jgi:hypothetical protein
MAKKNRRNQAEYPGLDPKLNLRTRFQELDFDYTHKLSEADKKWLNNFVEEEIHANLRHEGKKINTTKSARKRIYSRNNARNRDIFTREQAMGRLSYFPDLSVEITGEGTMDYLISKIDEEKKKLKKASRRRKRTKKSV